MIAAVKGIPVSKGPGKMESSDKKRKHQMEERRGTMDRKKFTATLVALAAGIVLSAGNIWAQDESIPLPEPAVTGYLMGDPSPGKLVPYFTAQGSTATIIGIENVFGNRGPNIPFGDVAVHVNVFDRSSNEIINFDLCYSPFSFGYIVLQGPPPSAAQLADLAVPTGLGVTRGFKSRVLSSALGSIPAEGYVSLRAEFVLGSSNGSCLSNDPFSDDFFATPIPDGSPTPLATWAIIQDVGTGFFGTEVPTPTANVVPTDGPSSFDRGSVFGGVGAFGLIPRGNQVIARYDVNPSVDSVTDIFIWFVHNGNGSAYPVVFDCEDELEISASININREVNIVTLRGTPPNATGALVPCTSVGQFRGVLRFIMPDTGFLWSHISQEGAHFRMNFLGYNLGDNDFIDCADGFNDFQSPFEDAPFLPFKEDTGHDADEDGIPPLCPPRDFCPE